MALTLVEKEKQVHPPAPFASLLSIISITLSDSTGENPELSRSCAANLPLINSWWISGKLIDNWSMSTRITIK